MTTLSTRLRTATAAAHDAAENSPFVTRLMAGNGSVADFAALTAQLRPVYATLEAVIEKMAGDRVVAAVHDPALARTARLVHDLGVLQGPPLVDLVGPAAPEMPATTRYVERLAAAQAPEELLAHHYVRYLGDLSGGQVVARLVARHYAVPADALTFYRFDDIAKPKPYKDAYRARLDALPLDENGIDLAVRTAIEAFELNRAVFADLERWRTSVPA